MSADPKPAHCPRLSKPISIVFNDTSSPGDDSNVTAEVRRADAERKAKAKYYHPIPTELFVEDFDGQTDTLARTGFNAKVPLYIFKVMAKYAGEVQFLLMEEVEKGVVVPVAETMGIRINEGGHDGSEEINAGFTWPADLKIDDQIQWQSELSLADESRVEGRMRAGPCIRMRLLT